jgi:cobalt transporter subunit CbtB
MPHTVSSGILHRTLESVATRAAEIAPAIAAAALGLVLLFGVGFAQPEILHDAAHDVRHTFAFPCH